MKLPSFQFYPGDWRKDPGVQALSFHDRGVWFEIICLLHESCERGKLLLNGRPMPDEILARLLGLDKQILANTLTTLISFGVASRDPNDNALICRRMVRDESNRQFCATSGHSGGNPKLTSKYNEPGYVYAIRRPSSGHVKIGIAINWKNRIQKVEYKISEKCELVEVVHVDDMGSVEVYLHSFFKSKQVMGEWFTLNGEDILTLKGEMKGKSKGEQRASSSSSSSSSICIKKEKGRMSGFDEFWAICPNKKNIRDAETVWSAKQLAVKLRDILSALTWQIPAYEWDGEWRNAFVPAKYLEDEKWTEAKPVNRPKHQNGNGKERLQMPLVTTKEEA